jgi:hypothetical protein
MPPKIKAGLVMARECRLPLLDALESCGIEVLPADSGARRKGFREERENDSGVKAKTIPG